MTKEQQLTKIKAFAKSFHLNEGTGHDWFHIERVTNLANKIALSEQVDYFYVSIVALLHDVADYKLNNGDENSGFIKITNFLSSIDFSKNEIDNIIQDIKNISFKGGNNKSENQSLVSKIVQDADRLDALGAIGIARAFAYGGSKKRLLYDPEVSPQKNQNAEQYKNSNAPTINHFYEKLLLLKDLMNTATGKKLAQKRHVFLEQFLEQFYSEWNEK